MGFFKDIGYWVGEGAGLVTGGPVKLVAEVTNNDFLRDVGDGLWNTAKNTCKTAGQVIDGATDVVTGLVQQDNSQMQKGVNQLQETATRTIYGVSKSIENTVRSGADVVQGIVNNDMEQAGKGAQELAKKAIITTLGLTPLHVLDGLDLIDVDEGNHHNVNSVTIDNSDIHHSPSETVHFDMGIGHMGNGHIHHINTINDQLTGNHHPITDVPFETKDITLPSGEMVEGTFPVFDSKFNFNLTPTSYEESDHIQFLIANVFLMKTIEHNPLLSHEFSPTQLEQINHFQTPDGYTWHHSEEPGKLQLVDEEIHAKTAHTGGRELWGGGTINR